MIFKSFLVWLVQFLKNKSDTVKFSWLTLLFNHYHINIWPYMSEQEKKQQRMHDLLNAETIKTNI